MDLETGDRPPIPMLTHEELADVHTIVIQPEGLIFSFQKNTGATFEAYHYRYWDRIHQWLENRLASEARADYMMNDIFEGPVTGKSWGTILSETYDVDREKIDDFIWNISPEGMVERIQSPVNAIWKLKDMGKRVVLFSHSHRTWMNNILQYLQLTKEFELRCTGDAYPNPADAVRGLYYGTDLSRTALVSSFMGKDFASAHNAGMQVFRHKTHTALIRLVNGTQ